MHAQDDRMVGITMASDDKTRVNVDIFGAQYKLVSNSSTAYTKRVAELVDDRMKKVAKLHPRLDSQRIAVLAAVQVADELLRLQQEHQAAASQALAGVRESDEEKQRFAKELEEARSSGQDLEERYGVLLERYEQLKADYESLRHELQQSQLEARAAQEAAVAGELAAQSEEAASEWEDKYRKLSVEYEKLKAEYNEWIEFMENSSPGMSTGEPS